MSLVTFRSFLSLVSCADFPGLCCDLNENVLHRFMFLNIRFPVAKAVWRGLGALLGGSMPLEADFESLKTHVISTSLCFLLVVRDRSSAHLVPASVPLLSCHASPP